MLTSKQRLLAALDRQVPDRLPVTTHHVMPYYLNKYLPGTDSDQFFNFFGLDPITWTVPHKPFEGTGDDGNPEQGEIGFLGSRQIVNDQWRISKEELPDPRYRTFRYAIQTPKGELTAVLQSSDFTTWVTEHLIKDKRDIERLQYATAPACDVEAVNAVADQVGQRGIVRGHIPCFEIFGQPGCWQDAACLMGIEPLIMATYSDPQWVHELLRILQARKLRFVRSLKGARYDLLELGGGDASSTVIGPQILEEFVLPYDGPLIAAAHEAGQRIVYHTCGGMMPFLEKLASMHPNAMETLTPTGMGGDVRLAEAKRRIGDKVCLIGGFDQLHFYTGCAPEQTRAEVRRCFAEAGAHGGFILSPSDHFFDAEPELLMAFADEARKCIY
jgi:uroporphyrinogen-III decarboxylase